MVLQSAMGDMDLSVIICLPLVEWLGGAGVSVDWEPDELLALALARPPEALTAARQVLADDPSALQASVAHQAAGVVLRDFGDIAEAVKELRTARLYARKAKDPDREADILASLGAALVMAGQTRRGLSALDAVVEGSRGIPAGRILIRRTYALWLLGRNAEALRDAHRAVALLTGAGDPVWEARAFNHRAMVYLASGEIDRADRDYARCETLFAETGQQLEYATIRQDRAITAFARGDIPTALAHLDYAERLIDELGVFEPDLFVNKCTVLLAAGLARDALADIDVAISRIETQRGPSAWRAQLLYCAALAAYAAGDLAVARRRGVDALRLFRRQHRRWWAARTELVLLQCRTVGDDRSASLFRRASRVAAELDELDSTRAVEAHLLAGHLALARADAEEAQRHLRSTARARTLGMQTRSAGWLAQAMLCEWEGRSRAMLAACDKGLRQLDLYLRTLGATELRVLATDQGAGLASTALRHAVRRGSARQVLEWSERWRAVVLAIPPVRPPRDGELVADLAALRNLARRLDGVPEHDQVAGTLHRERRRLETAVRRLAWLTPRLADRPTERFRCADLLGELGPLDLIELTDADGELYAVVAGHEKIRMEHIGPTSRAERSLAHALLALRREGRGGGPHRLNLDGIGARLEADLLAGSARLLHDGPVVVVPNSRLHAVPWGLLPSLRERPIAVTPSATAWLRAHRTVPPSEGKVVLVGGPRLSTGTAEVRRLAQQYPQAVVLAEGAASAERVMSAIDGAWLVHIAAHSTFRADSPLFSAIELDDGPLTVYDLERLGRAPYRIVLSSCTSAVGAPTGADELLGLVSALISLGSAGVAASVVPVNDPATVPLMLTLHRHLQDGFSLAQALALARRSAADNALARATGDSFLAFGI